MASNSFKCVGVCHNVWTKHAVTVATVTQLAFYSGSRSNGGIQKLNAHNVRNIREDLWDSVYYYTTAAHTSCYNHTAQ